MVSFPHAKINIGLHVVEKRADGFHNIETLFYPLAFHEILEILPSKSFYFTTSGLSIEGRPDDNLCVKAYRLLQQDFDLPMVDIHLHKAIPAGAGLGGGSSDATHTLLLLNKQFNMRLTDSQLHAYASMLGSDCAFFLHHQSMMAIGRGEILTPFSLDLCGKYIIVVKPPVFVSTKEAYSGIVPQESRPSLLELLKQPIECWPSTIVNDFEETVFDKYPVLFEAKQRLYTSGAIYASMSGSGAALYGIFTEKETWERAKNTLPDIIFSGELTSNMD